MKQAELKLELIEWVARLDDPELLAALLQIMKRNNNIEGSSSDHTVAENEALYERSKPMPASREEKDPDQKQADATDDWYDQLTEEQRAGIARGIEDIEAGRFITSKDLWKEYGRER